LKRRKRGKGKGGEKKKNWENSKRRRKKRNTRSHSFVQGVQVKEEGKGTFIFRDVLAKTEREGREKRGTP